MPDKILVTGGNGYIGSHMTNLLLKSGFEVIIIDDYSNSNRKTKTSGATLIEGNVSDSNLLQRIFNDNEINAVFHFAASIEAGVSMKNPAFYYKNNLSASIVLLDAIVKYAPKAFFIFSSTGAVYQTKNEKLRENDELNPANIYGKTKLMVEQIIPDLARVYDLNYAILRYFNACGADYQNGLGENRKIETHLIPLLLRYINRADIDFSVFGSDYQTPDGTCIRDYIHVQDIASAHLEILRYLKNGGMEKIFNIGTGKGYSVLELVKKAEEISGKRLNLKIKDRRIGDPDFLVASNDLILNQTNWVPKFSDLNNIINSAWNWELIISNRL